MDLGLEAQRLRLDLLAVAISAELTGAGIPHALLKGPSTANWLYDPPRTYNDVDILVPLSQVGAALGCLETAGLAFDAAGGIGEEAPHSLLMHDAIGHEVDLHISLPTVPPAGDHVWSVLAPHVRPFDLGVGTVPALDAPARCLVLALHALGAGVARGQAVEDLRRSRHCADAGAWAGAAELARKLRVVDLFEGGLGLIEPRAPDVSSVRAYLYATDVRSATLGLQRLREARRRELPALIGREIFPTRGFMRHAYPDAAERRFGLWRSHLRRWKGILMQLPASLKDLRAAKARR